MSAVGGVILLSSSPPKVFARSPTPVDNISSSPTLPSPGTIFASQRSRGSHNAGASQLTRVDRQRKFKITSATREGFGGGFSSLNKLPLKEKTNKENVPIQRRVGGSEIQEEVEPGKRKIQGLRSPVRSQPVEQPKRVEHAITKQHEPPALQPESRDLVVPTQICRARELSPLGLDKAFSRRLDWTPPASRTSQASPKAAAAPFPESLLGSFGYNAAPYGPKGMLTTKPVGEVNPTKRRKLDIVDTGTRGPVTVTTAPNLPPKASKSGKDSTRNRKSSPKKYTTITGLATSHYFGEEAREASPMMQYLSATQQRALDNDSDTVADTAKRKNAAKKSRTSKKAPRKSALRSPKSALKALENQDMLFGSASQLARDESPTFIRDTVQAIKHSEDTSLMSDPLSTQVTIPISESAETPKRLDRRGVSRFLKTRNLWSAAGRDHDNALLQVDTVDMFDSPDIRTAFAGKDVLLEPGAPTVRNSLGPESIPNPILPPSNLRHRAEEWLSPASRGGGLLLSPDVEGLIDIDDPRLKTPHAVRTFKARLQVRILHTAAAGKTGVNQAHRVSKALPTIPPNPLPQPEPTRPSFKGLTTSQLASQLSAYGFKPIKKREKMIELLDRCWDDKHNVANTDTDATSAVNKTTEISHGDFLTKVHDISARPTPKVKKPRGRTKKDGASSPEKSMTKGSLSKKAAGETAVDNKAPGEKTKKVLKSAQPRLRKAKDITSTSSASLKCKIASTSHAKAKTAPLSEECVMDVDDIEDDEHDFEIGVAEGQSGDNTGVKRTQRGCPRSLPPIPPSSDAFETAPWLDDGPHVSTSKSTFRKAASSIDGGTSHEANPSSVSAITLSTSPTSPATTTTTAPPPSTVTPTSTLSPPSPSQPPLSTQITLAITTFKTPPNHNSQQNPTFHQKILMYDPVVLEDLAAWLNTEGFKAIGEDREVGPIEMREWCEERGICCLWRGGWRGNGSSGKGARGQGRGKEMKEGGFGDD